MICDLEYNTAANTENGPELRLLTPVICAFRSKPKAWQNFLPQAHRWMFELCKMVAKNKGWDINKILFGETPAVISATISQDGAIELLYFVEGFQYSKLRLQLKEEKCG